MLAENPAVHRTGRAVNRRTLLDRRDASMGGQLPGGQQRYRTAVVRQTCLEAADSVPFGYERGIQNAGRIAHWPVGDVLLGLIPNKDGQ